LKRLKYHYYIVFAFFFFISCGGESQKNIQTSLLKEAPAYTQRERKAPPYQIETCGSKPRACLVQEGNTSSDFVIHLHRDPVLQYTLIRESDPKHSSLITGIVVESDFPTRIRQEYSAVTGSFQELNLKKFEDRATRIRFFVKQQPLEKKSVQWIEPLVLHHEKRWITKDSAELEDLRARHKSDNVFLIVLDAGGVSHFGFSGYSKNTTPILDSLAKEGIFWDHAVSHAASTVASTGSLLTGLYPSEHKTTLSNSVLKERFLTLAEYFRAYGYRTALFSGNPNASSMTGYGQGFEFQWKLHSARLVNASDFVAPVKQWIDSGKNQKLFAYLHFREPHSPFTPPHDLWKKMDPQTDFNLPPFVMDETPEPQVRQRIVAAYDANLASADRELGKIFDHLKKVGLWKNSVIIVLADHGEAFWEHGKQGHNYPLYEELLRIPFLIRIPEEPELAGKRISYPVASFDLFPTLVDLLQFSRRDAHWSGISLLPSLYQNNAMMPDRLLVSQTARRRIYSCRWKNLKYIFHDKDGVKENELYDLNSDPQEKQNLIKKFPILAAYLHHELAKYLHQSRVIEKQDQMERRPPIEPEVQEELRALGYVDQ
jgi:choline-sulfatase